MFFMNFYMDASYSGSAIDCVKDWVNEYNKDPKGKGEKIDYFNRGDIMFHMNIYTSSKADEKAYDLADGAGSVWSSYLMEQGDKKPKHNKVLKNKNSEGECKQTTQTYTLEVCKPK
jgi:hypothetical protein